MKNIEAGILAIGNEILLGRIVNKNASSLSGRLLDYKIKTLRHAVVEDSQNEISSGLDFVLQTSSLIFVSGGLGPTRDDLTREAISHFTGRELEFREDVYERIKEKLKKRDVKITENHKKQAMFPKGSEVMQNDPGTADGFYLEHDNKYFFVIPGPPNEIDSCWQNFIDQKLKEKFANQKAKNITTFHILGLPESEVADKVEKIVKNYSGLETEYRLHLPYLELRFQSEEGKENNLELLEKDLKKEFGVHYAYKNEESIAKQLGEKIEGQSILFVDPLTKGYLAKRLNDLDLNVDLYIKKERSAEFEVKGYDYKIQFTNEIKNGALRFSVNDREYRVERLSERSLPQRLEMIKLVELALWKLVEIV